LFVSLIFLPLVAIGVRVSLSSSLPGATIGTINTRSNVGFFFFVDLEGKHSDPTASVVFIILSFEDNGINWISWLPASPLDDGWLGMAKKRYVSCVVDSKSHEQSSP
jgi:hypothetical protein